MSRLIDADALIEVLNHLSYFNADDMQELVASQPTAFDTEKVVEQLEKEGQKMAEAKPTKRRMMIWY